MFQIRVHLLLFYKDVAYEVLCFWVTGYLRSLLHFRVVRKEDLRNFCASKLQSLFKNQNCNNSTIFSEIGFYFIVIPL